jgi:hypothetical protein
VVARRIRGLAARDAQVATASFCNFPHLIGPDTSLSGALRELPRTPSARSSGTLPSTHSGEYSKGGPGLPCPDPPCGRSAHFAW